MAFEGLADKLQNVFRKLTGKGKLSGKDPPLQGFHGDLPAGRQQAKGQGQVEGRAALAASGRGQVHGDARGRQTKAAGPQG